MVGIDIATAAIGIGAVVITGCLLACWPGAAKAARAVDAGSADALKVRIAAAE